MAFTSGVNSTKAINMLLDRIENFEIFRPKMDSSKEVLHAIATFEADISPCLPLCECRIRRLGL